MDIIVDILSNRILGELEFNKIPENIIMKNGRFPSYLKLKKNSFTTEMVVTCEDDSIALNGSASMGITQLDFQLQLCDNISWKSKQKMKVQNLTLEVPITQLHIQSVDQSIFKVNCRTGNVRWETKQGQEDNVSTIPKSKQTQY